MQIDYSPETNPEGLSLQLTKPASALSHSTKEQVWIWISSKDEITLRTLMAIFIQLAHFGGVGGFEKARLREKPKRSSYYHFHF